jgi:adenosine deaminase CECR1
MIGSESMTLHGWRMLAEWSLQYSCLSPADLLSVKAVWLERWEKFCQWIIDSYNDHGEPINPQTETKGWLA